MKTLILFALILSSHAFAADRLIKTFDGSVALCNSKLDEVDHSISAVYRPVQVQTNSTQALVTIEFLRCTEKGFLRDLRISERTVRPIVNPENLIEISRTKLSLIVVDERGELVDKKTLTMNNDGTFSALIIRPGKAVDFMVQSFVEIKDKSSGVVIDRYFETLGSYRLR